MSFRISALPAAPFAHLYGLPDEELRRHGAVRRVADRQPGFPCRVSLKDADVGDSLLLLNHEHLSADSPYRASHAIYVREGARQAHPAVGEVPQVLRSRLLSVRAYDEAGMMVVADVVDGTAVEGVIETMLAQPEVAYLHLHNAKPGCYAARVDRAD
jgi:hypothetical protein